MVTRELRVELLAPGRGALFAELALDEESRRSIAAELARSGRCDVRLASEVADGGGNTVARLVGSHVIRRRRGVAHRGSASMPLPCNDGRMRALDWNGLQFVLALARHGALERAAEELGVDPSTVSRRVRALENALGARVFDRTMSGHRLTAVGSRLAETAEHVASDIADMEREAARADERLVGAVRIATSDAMGRLFVAPFAVRFHLQHPLVDFQIVADQRAANLVRREADMAIRFVRTAQAQLVSRRLATIGHGLYASREYLEAHPFGGDEPFRGHVLLGYHESLARMPEARWLDERASGSRFAVRANRAEVLLAAASSGMGLAVLPCYLAEAEPRLVRLLGPDGVVRREVWLVMHRDLRRIARFRAFADHLASEFGKLGSSLQGDVPSGAQAAPGTERRNPTSKRSTGPGAS